MSGRESTKAVLERYFTKQASISDRAMKRGSKKNKKPEKDFEREFLPYATRLGFDLHVVESKAVYSQAAGRYLRSQTSESLPDVVGCHAGLSVWIELKAPGRLSTLKSHQKEFLEKKINQGCFACVTDSTAHFQFLWNAYIISPDDSKIQLLMDALP